MSEECSHDCSSCSQSCGERQEAPESFLEKPHPLSHIKKVIGVVSGKGGVGKSLVTSLSAVTMKRRGFQTGILDADITGPSIPKIFGIHGYAEGNEEVLYPRESKMGTRVMSINLLLDGEEAPVIWRGPILGNVVKQFWAQVVWDDVDFLFVDMPPGTGDVPLTVFQSIPLDGILIVTSPQDLVSMIVAKAVNMAREMNIPILGLVENMSYFTCPDCKKEIHVFGESKLEETAKRFDLPILARLPINPDLAKLCDNGCIELFEGDWMEPLGNELEKLLS